ncbi:MAG: hypothetical protein QOF95_2468 [Pseudonocardiales bacterium]|nr:hypothetical protein [Pseudonocardiales bacterium]
MKRYRKATLAILATGVLALSVASAAAAAAGSPGDEHGKDAFTFAVIGDIPYGDPQIANFPHVIAQINADPKVTFVDHLGDIKSGSSLCSDAYFAQIKSDFDQFRDPLVYTVGDNEWTDCHRANNGGYKALERLSAIRTLFFPRPGYTLGQHSVPVTSQATSGFPENVRYTRADVSFAAVHIVGSNNSLAPWTGNTTPTPEQTVEVLDRTASVIQTIRDAFASAKAHHNRSVVLLTQADMFDPTVGTPSFADYFAFAPIVKAIAQESASFRAPVYLFNGDSHVYNSDKPLGTGSSWLSFYGVNSPVNNLSRITIDGSTGVDNYVRVTVDPHSTQVLTWTRVPFAS